MPRLSSNWSYGYSNGRLTSYTDAAGNQTTYAWALGTASTDQTVQMITDPVNESGQRPTTVIQTYADEATDVAYRAETSTADAGYTFQYNTNPVAACDGDAHNRRWSTATSSRRTSPPTVSPTARPAT